MWDKWWRKLWKAYPIYSKHPTAQPPKFMRTQFLRDLQEVIEAELAVIAPEKTTAKPIRSKKRRP